MIPENSKKKLEQLRQETAFRAQLSQQYDKEMAARYTRDMPSFTEWLDKRQQNKAKGGKVEVRPTVKDDALMRKIPQMEEAAKKVGEGKMSHAAYDKVVAKHKPVKPYEFVPKPASDEDAERALYDNKKPHWRSHEQWPAGRKVGLRLDIPAYEGEGVWVNSIHDEEGKGEDKRKTSYGPVSSVKNATFDAGPSKAHRVATGEDNKSPFARIKGELHHMSEDEAVEHMKKNLNHPDYAQVGMDPRRHGYFYDRKTMKPVTHAKHVVQIGPLVLAHKPTYGERETYAKGGKVKPSQHEMRQALLRKANGGVVRMAGGGILQDVIKPTPVAKKPNELSGVVLSGASWLAGDEKTKLANQAFGQDVTNTAVGGYKTADVLNQLNVFERDGGTFAPGTTVVLDIGANDIATGVDPAITRANLDEIVSRLGENGVSIILSAQPFANSFQEAIDNPNLVMNEMYSDIAQNNPNVTLVDAMSGFLNQKNLMDESGFHLNNEQSKADYIGKFADAYKANHPTQNVVDTTEINTNPIGALPTNNVQDITTKVADTNQQSSPLQQAAVVDQTTPVQQEPIQQMSYKMPEYQMESNSSFKDFGDTSNVMERAEGGEVRTQQPFDYDNPSHVKNVANIAAKHRDFNQIPDAAKHLAGVLSQGSYKFVEDPRIQSAIKQAGHNGYYISGKDGKQQIIRKAEGGAVLPIEQIKAQLMSRNKGLNQLQSIGAEEAPSMGIKAYVPTAGSPDANRMPVGGIDTSMGDLPVGGIDMSKMQPGQQLMPNAPAGAQPGMDQVPRGDKIPTKDGTGMPPNPNANPNQMGSNILSMTPQGQAMAALKPQGLAEGGSAKSVNDMKAELAAKKSIKDGTSTRIKIDAEGSGGVKGIVVPRHMWEGKTYKGEGGKKVEGMRDVNEARAKVYGSERRDPLNSGQMNSLHKKVLAEHFAKPLHEQTAAEEEALNKLREAHRQDSQHIGQEREAGHRQS